MAVDSAISIDLNLRKDEAENRLRQFAAEAQAELQNLEAAKKLMGEQDNATTRGWYAEAQQKYQGRIANVQQAQKDIGALEMQIDRESARKGGKLFGIAVNKETERFAKQFVGAYVGRELMRIGFMAAERVGGDNHRLRMAEETVSGATEGAQIGAAFGPMGVAIGAVTGGLLGLASASVKLQKAIEREQMERNIQMRLASLSQGKQLQEQAYGFLQNQMTAPEKVKSLKGRLSELEQGEGQRSIKNLVLKLKSLEDKGDVESKEYQNTKAFLDEQKAKQGELRSQLLSAMMTPTLQWMDAGRVADSMQKQGIYTGNALDVGDVNKGVIDELKAIRKVAEKLALSGDEWLDAKKGLEYASNTIGARYSR